MKILKAILFISICFSLITCKTDKTERDFAKTETISEKNERMQWWRDAKFGMFIHWGGYSHLGGMYKGETSPGIAEWIQFQNKIPADEYASLIKDFNPNEYDPVAWAKLASEAGMKYLVITSKHHEGLAMWDSKVTDFDIVDFTPYGKDALKPLKEACEENDVKFCTYHSILDWHYPDANKENFPKYKDAILYPQLTEIMENLEPAIMWFDGEWLDEWTEPQGKDLYNYLRNINPDIIINNRVGKGRQGMQGMNKDLSYAGDFGTPEQEILEEASTLDWESCMTMNSSWGYKIGDDNWKSTEELIYNLVDVVAKGGNYLLNIGPDGKGNIPQESIKSLKEIGEWINVNGEAIYGSRKAEQHEDSRDLKFTKLKDGNTMFAISFTPPSNELIIKNYKAKENTKVYLLGYKNELEWEFNDDLGFIISIPKELENTNNLPCNYAWVFKFQGEKSNVSMKPDIFYSETKNPKNIVFNKKALIEIKCDDEADIFYSLDGSDVNKNSFKYSGPFEIQETCELKTVTISKNKISSMYRATVLNKTETVNHIELKHSPSIKYGAQGVLSLVDKVRGSDEFSDGKWLGFEGEDLDVTIDLGESKNINQLIVSFLHQSGAWIFLPEKISFSISNDGKSYTLIDSKTNDIVEETKDDIYMFTGNISQKARYIKIHAKSIKTCPSWHAGNGGRAWLFTDEIIIN